MTMPLSTSALAARSTFGSNPASSILAFALSSRMPTTFGTGTGCEAASWSWIFVNTYQPAIPAAARSSATSSQGAHRLRFGGLVPVLGRLRECAQDDVVEVLGNLVPDLRRRFRQLVQVLHCDLDGRVAAEGHLPSQHLVEDDPDRVEVGRSGHGGTPRLLRREVLRRPHDRAGFRHLGGARPRDPEVRHLEPLAADEDVVGLDVAVDDPVAVREAKRIEDLE